MNSESTPQVTRPELAKLEKAITELVRLAIEAKFPTVKDKVSVTYDLRSDIFFRTAKNVGHERAEKPVKLFFCIGPMHARFSEMVAAAGQACAEMLEQDKTARARERLSRAIVDSFVLTSQIDALAELRASYETEIKALRDALNAHKQERK